jgi:integrase
MARQRRGNGEGGVSRRKDGSWMARYTVQTPSGRKRKVIYAKSQPEARRKLTEALADRDRGFTYDAEGLTVEGYLARWLEDSVRGSVKITTYVSYRSLVRNHVCPTLGGTKLAALTPAHVQTLYRRKLEEGLAPKTVKYIHTTLHRALRQAVRRGLVPRNAAAEADPPRVSMPEMRPLSPTQARELLQEAGGNRLEALYVLAVTTGMRQGELLGLKWEDVDLKAKTVRVRRTLTLARGGPRLTEPKTKGSRRSIRLTSGAVDALERHRERQDAEGAAAGGVWNEWALVFCTRRGTPIGRDNLHDKHWKPLLGKAGLPDIRFHDLRHTCATLLLTKGMHPKIVSEMLGYSSIAITLDTYSHVIPGLGRPQLTRWRTCWTTVLALTAGITRTLGNAVLIALAAALRRPQTRF